MLEKDTINEIDTSNPLNERTSSENLDIDSIYIALDNYRMALKEICQRNEKKIFVEKIFNDDIEGEYDEEGFFITPNGSFWDPDGVYFNEEGYDKHGGYYEKGEYIPGKGWDEDNNCYKDELNDEEEIISDYEQDDEENDGFDQVDINKIHDEEKLIKITDDIEKINEDPSIIIHQI